MYGFFKKSGEHPGLLHERAKIIPHTSPHTLSTFPL